MLWIWAFLLFVGVLLPLGAWSSRSKSTADPPTDAELPSVRALALQAIIVHTVTFVLAWVAASAAGVTVAWNSSWEPIAVLAAIGVFALGMLVAWLDAKRPADPNNVVGRTLEKTKLADPTLVAMLLSAGIAEEFVYRGALTSVLSTYLGYWFAAFISALLFGLAHVAQGWRGFLGSAIFAMAFQGVVWLSGGLLLAMITHTVYDFGAVWLSRRLSTQNLK